ncbi:hypothetical protein ABPG74_007896 [Tetrahymena malaccensis]
MMQEYQTERINQLEAMKIDQECSNLLKDGLVKAFQYFNPQTVNKYIPEFNLIVDFIYFRETVNKNNNLPGNQLQNVKYTASDLLENGNLSNKRKIIFFLVKVVGTYAINKLHNLITLRNISNNGNDQEESKFYKILKKILDIGEKIYKVLNLANFVSFLINGKYRSIEERICGIQMSYINPQVVRYLDFELINRTIVWGIISDFVKFALPLANNMRLFKMVSNLFMFTTFLGSISNDASQDIADIKCGVCEDSQITMPRQINNCKHVFCYYCITSYLQSKAGQQNIKCPQCDAIYDKLEVVTN